MQTTARGLVLPAAINEKIFFAVGLNGTYTIRLFSYDQDELVEVAALRCSPAPCSGPTTCSAWTAQSTCIEAMSAAFLSFYRRGLDTYQTTIVAGVGAELTKMLVSYSGFKSRVLGVETHICVLR